MEKALAGERLLEKELPELPEQDVRAQAPPERKAPSLDEWIGMLHAWRDALRAGRTSVEAAVETLTRHERQLSEDMLRMQLQESKMTSYCHLADTVARGVFNSVTAELMNFQTVAALMSVLCARLRVFGRLWCDSTVSVRRWVRSNVFLRHVD